MKIRHLMTPRHLVALCLLSLSPFLLLSLLLYSDLRHWLCLRVEFLLKTIGGYPKDTGVTLFTLAFVKKMRLLS